MKRVMSDLLKILSGGLFLGVALLFSPVLAARNSCVGCHSGLSRETFPGRAYRIWKGSVHERHGVTCDRCHGGDPSNDSIPGAHRQVLPPANPKSRVNSVYIPHLCGRCHQPQLNEFTRSKHYKVLLSSKQRVQGPTCVTCHGSMHTSILSPDNVASACRRCHNSSTRISPNIPEEAHATLNLIFYAKNTVKWSGEFVNMARSQGINVDRAADALRDAREKFHLSEVMWHSFDFHEILKMVDGAYQSAQKAKRLADRAVTRSKLSTPE